MIACTDIGIFSRCNYSLTSQESTVLDIDTKIRNCDVSANYNADYNKSDLSAHPPDLSFHSKKLRLAICNKIPTQ